MIYSDIHPWPAKRSGAGDGLRQRQYHAFRTDRLVRQMRHLRGRRTALSWRRRSQDDEFCLSRPLDVRVCDKRELFARCQWRHYQQSATIIECCIST